MIAKITKGSTFKGAVNYILDKAKGTELIASEGVRTLDNNSIIQSFVIQAKLNSKVSKSVGHISLDFSSQDKSKLSNEFMYQITLEYMEKMTIVNTQFIIGRHHDKDHPHIHILYNRINNEGETISDKNDRYRSAEICKELTIKHGLYYANGKERVKTHRLKEPTKSKYEIYHSLRDIVPMSTNWQELINYLKCENIEVKLKTKGNSNEIQGILFSKNGFSFSGSKIDRQFSYSKINAELLRNNHLMRNCEGLTTQSLLRNSETSNLIDIIPISLYNSIDDELNNKKKRKSQR